MKASEIIGRKESLSLEFKDREVLGKPATVGREVVGMLNAKGGAILIGVVDHDGQAGAIQPLDDADVAERNLLNHLVDTIEPSPRGTEIMVETCDLSGFGRILRVRVKPEPGRQPYAQLKSSGGRYYYVRIGDRNRLMTREELAEAWSGTEVEEKAEEGARSQVLREREKLQKRSRETFWLCILPIDEIAVEIQSQRVSELLRDASLTGNRPTGWVFANPYREPELRKDRIVQGVPDGIETSVYRSGKITFSAPLASFQRQGPQREIHPDALLEFPTSVFRLAAQVYSAELAPEAKVMADLALFGLEGWTLRPYSPSVHGYRIHSMQHDTWPFDEGTDFVDRPISFESRELCDEPDWCSYRLIKRVYEAYGHTEDLIPREFDPKTRKLLIKA